MNGTKIQGRYSDSSGREMGGVRCTFQPDISLPRNERVSKRSMTKPDFVCNYRRSRANLISAADVIRVEYKKMAKF
jgi:hypothetical protein